MEERNKNTSSSFGIAKSRTSVSQSQSTEQMPRISRPPQKEKRPLLRRIWDIFFGGERLELRFDPRRDAGVDRTLVILICLLMCFGTVMVFSASYAYAEYKYSSSFYYIKRQIMWVAVGMIIMFIASRFPPSFYKMLSRTAFAVTVLLLMLVPVIGKTAGGAKRWIAIGSFTLQPSEIAKMTLVLMLAWYYTTYESHILQSKSKREAFTWGTLIPFGFIGIICGLIALEKHLSGLIILGLIGVLSMIFGGTKIRYLALLGGMGGMGVTFLALFTDYTKRRINIWLDPEAHPRDGGWQTLQGMMAIGSGGLFGLGLGNSRLKYSYVSEPQNDMIFTIACEELGLVGAVAILTLFALFILRGYTLAMRHPDRFSQIAMLGLVSKIAIQVLLNVAVVTNTIPNTGISLPFFSYGGSSLVILLCEMGILLSMSRSSNTKK